jgi:hypothetical protein
MLQQLLNTPLKVFDWLVLLRSASIRINLIGSSPRLFKLSEAEIDAAIAAAPKQEQRESKKSSTNARKFDIAQRKFISILD